MMQTDWHPADIIAALKKRGTSLSAVSRQANTCYQDVLLNIPVLITPFTKIIDRLGR